MPRKFGVYVSEDIARELEKCMATLGVKSKSRLVQEALRYFIAEHRWRLGGRVAGVLGILYDHEIGHADEELTDIQHHYLDVITSALHVHLDERRCMLIIVVRGDSDRIKKLLAEIERVRGVLAAKPMLISG